MGKVRYRNSVYSWYNTSGTLHACARVRLVLNWYSTWWKCCGGASSDCYISKYTRPWCTICVPYICFKIPYTCRTVQYPCSSVPYRCPTIPYHVPYSSLTVPYPIPYPCLTVPYPVPYPCLTVPCPDRRYVYRNHRLKFRQMYSFIFQNLFFHL